MQRLKVSHKILRAVAALVLICAFSACAKKYQLPNGAYLYEEKVGDLYLYDSDGKPVLPDFTTHFKISSDYIYGDTKSKAGIWTLYLYNTREGVLLMDPNTEKVKDRIKKLGLPELEMSTDVTFGKLQDSGIKDLTPLNRLKKYPRSLTKDSLTNM